MRGFAKGNKYGHGRPAISLNKPELLLPIIFLKGKVNWANDFVELYKWYKKTTKPEAKTPAYVEYMSNRARFDMYMQLLPYLCTKIAVKDLDFSKYGPSESDKQSMTDQTASLIKALEDMNVKPKADGASKTSGLEDGPTQVPPTA